MMCVKQLAVSYYYYFYAVRKTLTVKSDIFTVEHLGTFRIPSVVANVRKVVEPVNSWAHSVNLIFYQ